MSRSTPGPNPTACWSISLDVECPGCHEDVDLLEYVDFWDHRHLEAGEAKEDVEVVCPKCGHEFAVNTAY